MTLVQDNSVQAINTALLSIKRDISASTATTAGTTAGLEPGKTYNINISGNAETATTAKTARTATNANHAETAETATKMSNALTVNGKTYNGSEAVDAGVQTVANGGTGVTTQADINKAFIGNLAKGTSDVTDGTEFVSSYAGNNGFSETGYVNTPYKRKFSAVWGYIKGKISSVLGLTKDTYGGTANKVASEGASGMWIEGRAKAICKTTSAAGGGGWKTLASIKTSSGSIEIGNLSGEDYIRVVYSSDADVNAGNNNVTQLLYIRRGNVETPHEFIANSAKASSKMVIPIGAPSSLEDGCIWIS